MIVVVLVFGVFYVTQILEPQGASSLGFLNSVGLVLVVLGVIAAGLILRRATPPT
jgi:hypothetical protein